MIIYDHIYIIFVCVFWKGKNPFAIFLYFPSYIEQPQRMLGTIEWVFCQAVHSVSLGLGLSRNEAMPKFIAMFHQKKLHRSTGLGFCEHKKKQSIFLHAPCWRHMPGTCPGLRGNPSEVPQSKDIPVELRIEPRMSRRAAVFVFVFLDDDLV